MQLNTRLKPNSGSGKLIAASSFRRLKKMADVLFAILWDLERSVCQALHPRRLGRCGPECLLLLLFYSFILLLLNEIHKQISCRGLSIFENIITYCLLLLLNLSTDLADSYQTSDLRQLLLNNKHYSYKYQLVELKKRNLTKCRFYFGGQRNRNNGLTICFN